MSIRVDDSVLKVVEKPSRYTGNELNSVQKNLSDIKIRIALCFPDVYEVGMSHLGTKILYHLLNQTDQVYCERVFAPWVDMEGKMRKYNIPLFSLETLEPVKNFDILGFTLQYEMSYTNIINILDLSGIPFKSANRNQNHPFICAAGLCAFNPEPLAEIVDFFIIGEVEEVSLEIVKAYEIWEKTKSPREDFLNSVSRIEGVYVPQFYNVKYNTNGTINGISPVNDNYPEKIRKRMIDNLDNVYFPDKLIVPFTGIVHDRIIMELFRGCIRGCRFCQEGFVYRPFREKKVKKLIDLTNTLIKNTGYEEINYTSPSANDYSQLEQLSDAFIKNFKNNIKPIFSNFVTDNSSLYLMEKTQKIRKKGSSFTPEAGTQRLRNVINKGATEEDFIRAVSVAFKEEWPTIKLFFIIGLPTETMDDVDSIFLFCKKIINKYNRFSKQNKGKVMKADVRTTPFVPRPFTPFQWEAQDSIEVLKEKQARLKSKIKGKNFVYKWHDPELSFIEAVLARGDRKLGDVIIRAWENGCRLDNWSGCFNFAKWMETFSECGIDPRFYANRKRDFGEFLPWDIIDVGINKDFLIKENMKAYNAQTTTICRDSCSKCGISNYKGGACFE